MDSSNKYLEKIAAMSVVGRAWSRDVLPNLSKHSRKSLSIANDKAKQIVRNPLQAKPNTLKRMDTSVYSGVPVSPSALKLK